MSCSIHVIIESFGEGGRGGIIHESNCICVLTMGDVFTQSVGTRAMVLLHPIGTIINI